MSAPLETPDNSVLGTIATETDKTALVKGLNDAGYFTETHVEVFHGEEALKALDPDGTEHGGLLRIWRIIQKVVSEGDHQVLESIEDTLKHGRYVVSVKIDGTEKQKNAVKQLMLDHNGTKIFFSDSGVVELLSGW